MPLDNSSSPKTEKDLGLLVKVWLIAEDWDCFPEAQIRQRGPRADLIAIKDSLLWVIETKLSLNLQVIEQALRWRDLGALYTSIAVLKPKRKYHQKFTWHSNFVDRFFRQEGLGLIFGDLLDNTVIEAIPPRLHRYNYQRSKNIIAQLDPRMKLYIPGSTSKEGFSSPYQRTIENAITFIAAQKTCSINELLTNIKTHFRVRAKARNFLIKHLCQHSALSYRLEGYNVIFEYKQQ
jgi:hypothetical protein